MTWDEFLDWESQAQAMIAAEMEHLQPRGGAGVTISGNVVTLEPVSVSEPPQVPERWGLFILGSFNAKYFEIASSAARPSGRLGHTYFWEYTQLGANSLGRDVKKITFKARAHEGPSVHGDLNKTDSNSRFYYRFPVRITLELVASYLNGETFRKPRVMATYIIDLRRDPVTQIFSPIGNDTTQVLRLTKIERIK